MRSCLNRRHASRRGRAAAQHSQLCRPAPGGSELTRAGVVDGAFGRREGGGACTHLVFPRRGRARIRRQRRPLILSWSFSVERRVLRLHLLSAERPVEREVQAHNRRGGESPALLTMHGRHTGGETGGRRQATVRLRPRGATLTMSQIVDKCLGNLLNVRIVLFIREKWDEPAQQSVSQLTFGWSFPRQLLTA